MKIAIITSICGSSSSLPQPTVQFKDIDYVAFVDRDHDTSTIWEQRKALDFTLDSHYKGRRNAKIYKVLPQFFLPDYDYWIWVDSCHDVVMHPQEIIDNYLKEGEIGVWKHRKRTCVYREGGGLLGMKWDHPSLITDQMTYYREDGLPKNNGLIEASALIRKNTPSICVLNLRWWEQICRYSSRDQLSLPYTLWKSNITPVFLPGTVNGGTGKHTNPLIPQVRKHISRNRKLR
jgi:hypothetical protein